MTLTDFTHDAPMGATNVAAFVERNYRESHPLQWVREAGVQNPFEAGATEVRLTTEWQAVMAHGVYRRVIADNGFGIGAEDWDGRGPHPLVKFFNEYGGSGKPIGGANENYGIGAKSSLLPWNQFGLVVISLTTNDEDEEDCSMIWVRKNPTTGEYGLRPFQTPDGYCSVVLPFEDDEMGIDWYEAIPDFVKEAGHGLTLILLGNNPDEDTVLGDIGRIDKPGVPGKQETRYMTSRYWELPLDVRVDHFVTTDKSKWPETSAEYKRDRKIVYFARQVKSCRDYIYNYLPKDEALSGAIAHEGLITLTDGTDILWSLWEGPDGGRDGIEYFEWKKGFVAALYEDEIYERQSAQTWRNWGISESSVRERLWLLVRPPMADAKGKDGVYPTSDRTQLRIQGTRGNRVAGDPLPWSEWATEFSQQIPEPVVEALAQARVERGPTDVNMSEEMKQKLLTRFAHRWRRSGFIAKLLGSKVIAPTFPTKISGAKPGTRGLRKGGSGNGKGHGIHSLNPKNNAAWDEATKGKKAAPTSLSGSLPDYDWRLPRYPGETRIGPKIHDFELGQGAEWNPSSTAYPNGLIIMNEEHPVVQEQLEYWTSEYTEDDADEIRGVVLGTFGMLMIANVAHGEHLKSILPRAEMLETELRSPWALTATMLGVIQQHAMIAPVVGGKLKKKVGT